MTEVEACPRCGTILPLGTPAGNCPKCLLAAALGNDDGVTHGSDAPTLAPAAREGAPPPDGKQGRLPPASVRYFGNYELLEEIARGGMGVVYKARQTTLKRIVAVKMILAGQLAGEAEVERFLVEAEAAANLSHPNIVAIHEVGEHDGQHYFSMDYIDGPSLADVIRAHPLAAREAAAVVKTLADAIHFAHQKGVLHRDLKPSNVLMANGSGQGSEIGGQNSEVRGQKSEVRDSEADLRPPTSDFVPKITDFGLAKRIEGDSNLTATGAAMGTPNYMPPEQASGNKNRIGPASDVYSLGAILYELLTGRPPFRAETPLDTVLQVLEAEPAPPRLLNPNVPKDLETICLKCLEKDPALRYPAAAELADDLARFLADEPIRARPIGLLEHAWRRAKKHHRVLQSIAAAVVITVVLGVAAYVGRDYFHRQQLSYLTLKTDGYPLTAEVLAETADNVLSSFTVPTDAPVELRGGNYRLRMSGPGELSETFQVSLLPRQKREFQIDLSQQQPWKPIRLEAGEEFELLDIAGHTDIILVERRFGRASLRRLDGATGESRWDIPLGTYESSPTYSGDPAASGVDVWKHLAAAWAAGFGTFVGQRSVLVKPAVDLDGDGQSDLVYAWPGRNDVILVALSGKSGELLWQHAWPQYNWLAALPLAVQVNANGRPELIVVGYRRDAGGVWAEALAGADGTSLWRHEFEDLPAPLNNPPQYQLKRIRQEFNFWHKVELVAFGKEQAMAIVAGPKIAGLRVDDGKPAWTTIDLGQASASRPQFADVDGDGAVELLVALPVPNPQGISPVEVDFAPRALNLPGDTKPGKAGQMHLAGQPLWTARIPSPGDTQRQQERSQEAWVHAVDLDGDGHTELAAPSEDGHRLSIIVLDSQGKELWSRALFPGTSSQCKQLLDCPDANGDGMRELVVVSLGELPPNSLGRGQSGLCLFVDVLSGKDGRSLAWWRGPRLSGRYVSQGDYWFESARWGAPNVAGLPQLLITTCQNASAFRNQLSLHVVSPLAGLETQRLSEAGSIQIADFNGDGLADLCIARETPDGTRLSVRAAAPPEAWRRLAAVQPAPDFDGDGFDDVVEHTAPDSPLLCVFSGRDGRRLSEWSMTWPERGITQQRIVNPSWSQRDLNGDGTPDLLIAAQYGGGGAQDTRWEGPLAFPLQALSGKTGRPLWYAPPWRASPEIKERQPLSMTMQELQPFCEYLDQDGEPEIVCAHLMSWSEQKYGPSNRQFWLTALAARDGRLLWSVPISKSGDLGQRVANGSFACLVAPERLDLDGDGVADLVVTVPDRNDARGNFAIGCEVRAISGKDGSLLWPPQSLDFWDTSGKLPAAIVGDLDADGRPEILLTRRVIENQDNTADFYKLLVLDGSTGKRRWDKSWKLTEYREQPPFAPLTLADLDGDGRRTVIVRYYDRQEPQNAHDTLLFLDADGHERRRILGASAFNGPQAMRVWAFDFDSDGTQELAYLDRGQVKVVSGAGEVLWERAVGAWAIDTILTKNSASTLVFSNGPTYFGLDTRTQAMLWRGEGVRYDLRQFRGTGPAANFWWSPAHREGELPRILSQREHAVSRVCLPTDAAGKYSLPRAIELAVAPRQGDPRLVRRLPWDYPNGPGGELFLAGGCSLVLVVLPGAFLYWMVRKGRWSLRTWLTLPLVVALMLAACHFFSRWPVFQRTELPLLLVAFTALTGTVWLFFPGVLLLWAWQRRWWRASLLLAASLGLALVTGVISYLSAAHNLAPEEHFDWQLRGLLTLWLFATPLWGFVGLAIAIASDLAARFARPRAKVAGTLRVP